MDKEFLYEDISYQIRGACFWIWKEFGNAFKESIVDKALTEELQKRELKVENQKRIDIFYRDKKVGTYVPDKIINDCILLEIKHKPFLTRKDIKQFWRYLKATNYKLGFLINFSEEGLQIKRIVYDLARNKSQISTQSINADPRADQRGDLRFRSASRSAFTLIEVLVGTFLILIVFLGIFGAYQLGLKVLGLNQRKIVATAIANQKIEEIRNLPYESVGTVGGFPAGGLEGFTTTTRNKAQYNIETRVDYVVDSTDGLVSPEDDCPNDYKRVEIKASWSGIFGGQIKLSTDVAPKNLAQECETTGGILSVSVFDAYGQMISSPLIEIKNPETNDIIKTATPTSGKHYFSLPTSSYKIVISKNGFSSEETFGSGDVYNGKTIITPENPHPLVLEGQLTEMSFSIDKVSSFLVDTLSPWGSDNFSDSFINESKISEKSNLVVNEGKVELASGEQGYFDSGFLISIVISPSHLIQWDKFSFTDSQPENTEIKYQIFYLANDEWQLIHDNDLPGNSTGFSYSPVNLIDLNIETYSQLKIKGNFATSNPSFSPALFDWQISWRTSQAAPIPNVKFGLKGQKIVGKDSGDLPIYKYFQFIFSDSQGKKEITNLEWDSYTFSSENPDLDLVEIEPSPQPIGLPPESNISVKLYLDSQNSLLITLQNSETLEPVFSATARLSNTGLGYDVTQYTNEKGQTFFIPLGVATYNLEISAPGYSPTLTTVSVSGDTTKIIKLEQIE